MATLIEAHNSDGCIGRCDAKCYNAEHPDCHCICGGRNHGAGRIQAEKNTRDLIDEWEAAWLEEHPDTTRFYVPDRVFQRSFLDLVTEG